jgi:hypothetical protein
MSEPITYRITFDFTTDRPLTPEELVHLGGQAFTQIHEPSEDWLNEDEPYSTHGVEMRLWVGDNEVAGWKREPVCHAHVAYYEFFEEGHFNRPSNEADDMDWHCFPNEAEADALAERWLGEDAWAKGSRVNVGVRMIVVPEWAYHYLNDDLRDIPVDNFSDWLSDYIWADEHRVAERMRVWLAS